MSFRTFHIVLLLFHSLSSTALSFLKDKISVTQKKKKQKLQVLILDFWVIM